MISLKVFDTPVKVKAGALVIIMALWAVVTWLGIALHPGRTYWQGLQIGLVTAIVLLFAEFGHPIAHIFSARYAKAPMDEIQISAGMPRTLYANNSVSPDVHRLRAIGGLIFNLAGVLLSLAILVLVPGNSLLYELAAWSALGHGLLFFMSLLPFPFVDGGTLLKWTLVAGGSSENDADRVINRIDWVLGIIGGVTGLVLITLGIWIVGAILAGMGLVVIWVSAGLIK